MLRTCGRTVSASTRRRRRASGGFALLVAFLAAAGCSSGSTSHPGAVVEVLKDFRIESGATHLKPGTTTFEVINEGPSTHEFIIDRTDLPADALPLGPTGVKIDEEDPRLHPVDEVPGLLLGGKDYLTVNLPAGHYVLYCNLEGHYEETMHVALVVG